MRLTNFLNEKKKTTKKDIATAFLETAACVGIFAKNSLISKIDTFIETGEGKEVINKKISEILKKPYDWRKLGIKTTNEVMKEGELEQYGVLLAGIKGMYKFINDVVSKNLSTLNFVHAGINKYYNMEKEIFGEIEGSKPNTADCLICNCNLDKLLETMKTSSVIEGNESFVEFENGVKYFQISLKKDKSSQLGKNLTKATAMGLHKNRSDDQYIEPTNETNEGKIFDFVKKISSSVWKKLKNLISNILKPFNQKVMKKFKSGKISDQELDNLIGLKFENKGKKNRADLIQENQDYVLRKINKIVGGFPSQNSSFYIKYDKLNSLKNPDFPDAAWKLAANLKTVNIVKELIFDFDNVQEKMSELIGEVIFGGTKLPIWVVYGDEGDGITYKSLGTLKAYIDKSYKHDNLEVFGIKLESQKGYYYSIDLIMLESVDNGQKKYVEFRTGTGGKGFSFSFGGRKYEEIGLNETINSIKKWK